jgi:ElaB/YqjD/DUF883 family membrane-anchored ribosome-binding protein
VDALTRNKLIDDLRVVARSVEELLKATANQTGERITEARSRAEESLRAARERLDEAGDELAQRTREAARVADDYVHEHPWPALATGAALAFLLGYLVGRR